MPASSSKLTPASLHLWPYLVSIVLVYVGSLYYSLTKILNVSHYPPEKAALLFLLLPLVAIIPVALTFVLLAILLQKQDRITLPRITVGICTFALLTLYGDALLWMLFEISALKKNSNLVEIFWIFERLVLVYASYKVSTKIVHSNPNTIFFQCTKYLALFFILASTIAVFYSIIFNDHEIPSQQTPKLKDSHDGRKPNILILSADGIRTKNVSFYGSDTKTTPFLDSKKKDSLVFYNHFSNATGTAAAFGSLVTSKLPTETKIYSLKDKFNEKEITENFPWILSSLGYISADFGLRFLTDPHDLHIQYAFNYANGRSLNHGYHKFIPFIDRYFYLTKHELSYILDIWKLHIKFLFNRNAFSYMPFTIDKSSDIYGDRVRVEELKAFILRNKSRPFFAHLHIMASHGPKYAFEEQNFSSGPQHGKKFSENSINFYNDSILQFDKFIKEIFAFLDELNLTDNTLIVVNSDHGKARIGNESVPLIFFYPKKSVTGVMTTPSSRIDIAPTILDYLGYNKPEWMKGESLLQVKQGTHRIIYVSGAAEKTSNSPLKDIRRLGVIKCDRYYQAIFTVDGINMSVREIDPYRGSCDPTDYLTEMEAEHLIMKHLDSAGYNTSQFGSR